MREINCYPDSPHSPGMKIALQFYSEVSGLEKLAEQYLNLMPSSDTLLQFVGAGPTWGGASVRPQAARPTGLPCFDTFAAQRWREPKENDDWRGKFVCQLKQHQTLLSTTSPMLPYVTASVVQSFVISPLCTCYTLNSVQHLGVCCPPRRGWPTWPASILVPASPQAYLAHGCRFPGSRSR